MLPETSALNVILRQVRKERRRKGMERGEKEEEIAN